MQQIGDLPDFLRGVFADGHVFDADDGAVAFGMVDAQNVVQQVGERDIAVFFADVIKRAVGHIPKLAAMDHIRRAVGGIVRVGPPCQG